MAITAAVVPNFRRAFRTPLSLAKRIAVGTPEAAFYFAKLAALSCGATPLRLLRPVSLLRRGWRIRSRPLKEKAAVHYGRTYPKVILAFATFSMFWVMVPAISLIALLYFFLVNVSTRYLVLYAHMPKFETGGAYYYVVVERILFSLGAMLPTQLTALLAPGPRGLARVDDGRAGLHLLVLSVGETRRLAIHTSNLKHVPRRRRRLPSQMRRPRPRDPLRAHRSRAETGARRSPAYRRGYVR